jgi:hypothetical protein
MLSRLPRGPGWAIALICGAALVTLSGFQYVAWYDFFTAPHTPTVQYVARYEGLRNLLPDQPVTGFFADERHLDAEFIHPGARLYLARFTLAPRRLSLGVKSRWVIVDSDHPEIAPEIATSSHWILATDLHNGVRLYRTY